MVIYTFVCNSCKLKREEKRTMGDTTPPECTTCTNIMRRSIGVVPISYKGSGFTKASSPTMMLDGQEYGNEYD